MIKPGYKSSEFWFTFVSFIFSGLYFLDKLFIIKINNNDLNLKQAPIIEYWSFFVYTFGTFNFGMVVPSCKQIPYLFGNCDVIVIFLLLFADDGIHILILFNRNVVEIFILYNKFMIDFSRMLFAYFLMFFLIALLKSIQQN